MTTAILATILVVMLLLEVRGGGSTWRWHAAALAGTAVIYLLAGYSEPAILFLAAYAAHYALCGPGAWCAPALPRRARLEGLLLAAIVRVPVWVAAAWLPARWLLPLAGTWLLFHSTLRRLEPRPTLATIRGVALSQSTLALDAGCAAVAVSARALFLLPDAVLVIAGSVFALAAFAALPERGLPTRLASGARLAFAWLLGIRLLVVGIVPIEAPLLLVAAIGAGLVGEIF